MFTMVHLQVTATDFDSDLNGQITYKIRSGDNLHQFLIDSASGYISVAKELDREVLSSYVLEVEAVDGGIPPLSSIALVNVKISDVNDNPPIFSERNYTAVVQVTTYILRLFLFSYYFHLVSSPLHSFYVWIYSFLQEDKPLGYALCHLKVSDADDHPNTDPFTFEIIGGNDAGMFRIEQDGIIRTAAKFNYKNKDTYVLQVRVFDYGLPPLSSDTWVVVKVSMLEILFGSFRSHQSLSVKLTTFEFILILFRLWKNLNIHQLLLHLRYGLILSKTILWGVKLVEYMPQIKICMIS